MPQNPVHHVAAVAGPESALPILVNEWISTLGVIQAFHQVFKWCPTPIAIDGVNELLSIAGGAVETDHNHHVAAGSEQLRIPAIAPFVAFRNLGPSMNDKFH